MLYHNIMLYHVSIIVIIFHVLRIYQFYSYTSCGSTWEPWDSYTQKTDDGITLISAIPDYHYPYLFKRDANENPLMFEDGEYLFDTEPEGVLVEYIDQLQELSKNDFKITFTYGSRGSKLEHGSGYTGAIQDIHNGLVDMAVGDFWITGQRLRLAGYTVPITHDRTVLVIKDPGEEDTSLQEQVRRVLDPFTAVSQCVFSFYSQSYPIWGNGGFSHLNMSPASLLFQGVWMVILLIIAIAALLSVWYSDHKFRQTKKSNRFKKSFYARMYIDEFLTKGSVSIII